MGDCPRWVDISLDPALEAPGAMRWDFESNLPAIEQGFRLRDDQVKFKCEEHTDFYVHDNMHAARQQHALPNFKSVELNKNCLRVNQEPAAYKKAKTYLQRSIP